MAGRKGEMDERAMKAARASHAARNGNRTSRLTLKDAAAQYSVSDKYVRLPCALLLSRMTHLVWEVGLRSRTVADRVRRIPNRTDW